ncbi:MAG: DUF262 domain-containing protein [Euryarchaeota archaeon]|nr:DUF262 domain-containing protein [Euryarchaeota archaeon]
MAEPIIKQFDLEELLDYIEKRNVAIPEFQRGYVWKEKQVKDLFDSLVKGYPIGSFIVWKTNQKMGTRRHLFVKEPKSSNEKYLVLDGQQRLLSLYYLCKQNLFLKVKSDFEEVCERKPLEFEHFYFTGKTKPKLNYSSDKTSEFNFEEFKKKLGRKYKFPVIIVSINEFEKAIEIFERINQKGTKISTEAIFLSEAWNKKTNLGGILRKWKNDKKTTPSSKLENIIFIHTLAIILQLEKIGDEYNPKNVDTSLRQLKKIAEKIREEKTKLYEKEFKKVLSAITEAMSFLEREFKIKKINELPSQTIVSILSVFFYYCDEPSKKQTKELKEWFWRSSLGSRYVGAEYNKSIRKDPIRMKELAKHNKPLDIPKADLEFNEIMNTDMRAGRSTVRNAIKLMLWNKEPIWISGAEINRDEVESRKRRKEDDHFYPYDFYEEGVISNENEINSILNLCYLPKSENSKKRANLPSRWLEERKKSFKSKIEDEEQFFSSNLLQFKSIEKLRNKELELVTKNGSIKPNKFREYYRNFVEQRFELFKKELNHLQRGL